MPRALETQADDGLDAFAYWEGSIALRQAPAGLTDGQALAALEEDAEG